MACPLAPVRARCIFSALRGQRAVRSVRWSPASSPAARPSLLARTFAHATHQEAHAQDAGQTLHDILFCGSDEFASIILRRLIEARHLYRSLQVLTSPDVTQSWGGSRMRTSAVKALAQEHGLTHHSVPREGIEAFTVPFHPEEHSPVLVTASFGHFLPASFLSAFTAPRAGSEIDRSRALNVHPSLLPKLRGAAPIQWAIARSADAGARTQASPAGVTVQELSCAGFDRGRVLWQEPFGGGPPLSEAAWTYARLMPLLAAQGAGALLRVLADLPGHAARAGEQDDAAATYAPKLRAEAHATLRWARWSAARIDARARGFGQHFALATTLVPHAEAAASGGFKPAKLLLHDIDLIDRQDAEAQLPNLGELLADPQRTRPGHAVFCESLATRVRPDPAAAAAASSSDVVRGPCLLVRCAPQPEPLLASGRTSHEHEREREQLLVVRATQQPGKARRVVDGAWWNGFGARADRRGRLMLGEHWLEKQQP